MVMKVEKFNRKWNIANLFGFQMYISRNTQILSAKIFIAIEKYTD